LDRREADGEVTAAPNLFRKCGDVKTESAA